MTERRKFQRKKARSPQETRGVYLAMKKEVSGRMFPVFRLSYTDAAGTPKRTTISIHYHGLNAAAGMAANILRDSGANPDASYEDIVAAAETRAKLQRWRLDP
jgi:hypothetical protein